VTSGRPTDRLPRAFFDRPATEVAPDLLGCVLWHDSPAGLVAVRLVEVEAYMGSDDPASHAYRGETKRNAVMFGPSGHVYVYFTYGMHFCANLVCQPAGQPEAVLLRAGEIITGADLAARRRAGERDPAVDDPVHETGLPDPAGIRSTAIDDSAVGDSAVGARPGGANGRVIRPVDLARGPARLCQALAIDRRQDGVDVCAPGSPLGIGPPSVADQQARTAGQQIIRTGPRVGISRAADRPWRYWLAGDAYVSLYKPLKPRPQRRKPVTGRGTEDGTMLR
jgi:DNA-3-methyladenine glycosylase